MTSFELFQLLNFKKKNLHFIYIYFILFPMKSVTDVKLNHFMKKKIKYFAPNYGIITGIKLKLCKKSCRKGKVGGA